MILTAKQANFVNKELNAGNGIMSIKKMVTPNKSEEAELDNAYQKALSQGLKIKLNIITRKRALCK